MTVHTLPPAPHLPHLPHEALTGYRQLLLRMKVLPTADGVRLVRAAGIRHDASYEVAVDRLRALIGEPVWDAMQGQTAHVRTSTFLRVAERAMGAGRPRARRPPKAKASTWQRPPKAKGSTWQRKTTESFESTEDDPACTACKHPESEHGEEDGSCSHEGCDCDGFAAGEEDAGDEPSEDDEKRPPPEETRRGGDPAAPDAARFARMASRSSASAEKLRASHRALTNAGSMPRTPAPAPTAKEQRAARARARGLDPERHEALWRHFGGK